MKQSLFERMSVIDSVARLLLIVACYVALVTLLTWLSALPLRRRPAVRHCVLLTGLICVGLIPVLVVISDLSLHPLLRLELSLPQLSGTIIERQPDVVSRQPSFNIPESGLRKDTQIGMWDRDQLRGGTSKAVDVESESSPASDSPTVRSAVPTDSSRLILNMGRLACFIWLGGSLLLFARCMFFALQLSGIHRRVIPLSPDTHLEARIEAMNVMGLKQLPKIGISSDLRIPVVMGFRVPMIVLPEFVLDSLSTSEVRDILVHETAHIVRGDVWVLPLEVITTIAYWPIPFLHLLIRELSRTREELCDLHALGSRHRHDYGQTLLRLARLATSSRPLPLATGILHGPGQLERRVARLLDTSRDESLRTSSVLTAVICTTFIGMTFVACSVRLLASDQLATPGQPVPPITHLAQNERKAAANDQNESDVSIESDRLAEEREGFDFGPSSPQIGKMPLFAEASTVELTAAPTSAENVHESKSDAQSVKSEKPNTADKKSISGRSSNAVLADGTGYPLFDGLSDEFLSRPDMKSKIRKLYLFGPQRVTTDGWRRLGQLTELNHLTFLRNNLSEPDICRTVLEQLVGLKSLHSIALFDFGITDSDVQLLERMPQLTSLTLVVGENLTDSSISSLAKLRNLKSLTLVGSRSFDDDQRNDRTRLNFAREALSQLSALNELEFLRTSVAVPGNMLDFPRLKHLDIDGQSIDDIGANQISKLRGLTFLSLSNAQISPAGWKQIATLPELKILNLSAARISDAGLSHFKRSPKLESLSLEMKSGKLSDLEAEQIAQITLLRRLNLRNTTPTEIGLKKIATLQVLHDLRIDNAVVTDAGVANLKGAVNLWDLQLQTHSLTDAALGHAAQIQSLMRLTMRADSTGIGNQFSIKGLQQFKNHPNLQTLWIGIPDRPKGDKSFINPRILEIELDDNPIRSGTTATQSTPITNQTKPTEADNANQMDDSKAIAKIEQMGGQVHRDEKLPNRPVVSVVFSRSQCNIDDFLPLLKSFANLRRLSLGGTKTSDDDLKSLSTFNGLTELNLESTKITESGLKHLVELSNLTSLSIAENKITDAGLKEISKLSQLKKLNLWGNEITDIGLKELVNLRNLTELNLTNCKQVTDSGLKEICELKDLAILWLTSTGITDTGLRQLTTLKQINTLCLAHTPITDSVANEFLEFPQLTRLFLAGTQITDVGLKEIGKLTQLTLLDLNATEITDVGLKEVRKLVRLESLDLCATEITNGGLKELIDLKNLTHLDLGEMEITDAGLKEVCSFNHGLVSLCLWGTHVTDSGLKELVELKQLDYLNLTSCEQITHAGVEGLKKSLPNLTRIHR